MKKLILLLFIPLVFACSSDSSDNNNNNSNDPSVQKLIESITVISGECENTYNLWLYYDNDNRITSYQFQYVVTNCNGDEGSISEIGEGQFEYAENNLTWTHLGEPFSFPINDDGTINDANLTWVDGYLISIDPNAGGTFDLMGCETTNIWVDNNLIETDRVQNANGCLGHDTINEYGSNVNPIPFFQPNNHINWWTAFQLTGALGKQSQNLISKETRFHYWGQSVYDFQYILDDDGYPIVIYTEYNTSPNNTNASVNYEITYIE